MIAGVLEIQIMAGLARISEDMRRAERIVGDSMAKVEKSARSARTAMESLTAGFGAMVALQQIKQMSDGYTKLDAQLRLSTKNQQEYNQALADVQRISTVAQTNIGATTMLYTRMMNVTKDMNIEQSKIATVAETVSYGLKAYGATAAEASSASLQLSQAMGANRLGGEEFRAVMEAMPNVMKVLADSMGVPLGELRQLSIDGKITTDVMLKAFSDPAIAAAMRLAAEQTRTIGGELVVMGNNAMQFVGSLMKLSGAQGGAIGAISLLSESLKLAVTYVAQITSLLLTLAAVYAGKFVISLVQARIATMAMNAAQTEATAINLAMAQSAQVGAKAGLVQAAQVALMTGNTKLATSARIEYMAASEAVAAAEALHAQATMTWMGKLKAFAAANMLGLIGLALWGIYTVADHMGWVDKISNKLGDFFNTQESHIRRLKALAGEGAAGDAMSRAIETVSKREAADAAAKARRAALAEIGVTTDVSSPGGAAAAIAKLEVDLAARRGSRLQGEWMQNQTKNIERAIAILKEYQLELGKTTGPNQPVEALAKLAGGDQLFVNTTFAAIVKKFDEGKLSSAGFKKEILDMYDELAEKALSSRKKAAREEHKEAEELAKYQANLLDRVRREHEVLAGWMAQTSFGEYEDIAKRNAFRRREYLASPEGRVTGTMTSAATSAFFMDNGKSFTDNFANALKKTLEPAFQKLVTTLIMNTFVLEKSAATQAAATSDWIMAIVALISTQFGNEARRMGSFTSLTATQAGATAGTKNEMMQLDAQWFTAQENWNITTNMSIAELNKYSAAISDTRQIMSDAGDALGYANTSAKAFDASISTSGDVMLALTSKISQQLLPALVLFQREGENMAQTAERLTKSFVSTSDFITALGVSSSQAFGGMGLQSASARESLIAASGGLSEFTSNSKSFISNFLTNAEKMAPAADAVARTFERLGIVGVSTNEQFAQLVKEQMALGNTSVVGELLSVAGAFDSLTKSAATANEQINGILAKETFSTMVDWLRASKTSGSAAGMIATATAGLGTTLAGEQAGTAAFTAANSAAIAAALVPIVPTITGLHEEGVSKWDELVGTITHAWDALADTFDHWFDVLSDGLMPILETLTHWLTVIVDTIKHWIDVLPGGGGSGGGFNPLDPIGLFSANGNVFGSGGTHAFADGSAFTNGLYSSPTRFMFADGGGFSNGVMGEAGPEAVMPLRRDASGRLGVSLQGGGGNSAVVAELQAMRNELTMLRAESRSERAALVGTAQRTERIIDKWDHNGMPEVVTI